MGLMEARLLQAMAEMEARATERRRDRRGISIRPWGFCWGLGKAPRGTLTAHISECTLLTNSVYAFLLVHDKFDVWILRIAARIVARNSNQEVLRVSA